MKKISIALGAALALCVGVSVHNMFAAGGKPNYVELRDKVEDALKRYTENKATWDEIVGVTEPASPARFVILKRNQDRAQVAAQEMLDAVNTLKAVGLLSPAESPEGKMLTIAGFKSAYPGEAGNQIRRGPFRNVDAWLSDLDRRKSTREFAKMDDAASSADNEVRTAAGKSEVRGAVAGAERKRIAELRGQGDEIERLRAEVKQPKSSVARAVGRVDASPDEVHDLAENANRVKIAAAAFLGQPHAARGSMADLADMLVDAKTYVDAQLQDAGVPSLPQLFDAFKALRQQQVLGAPAAPAGGAPAGGVGGAGAGAAAPAAAPSAPTGGEAGAVDQKKINEAARIVLAGLEQMKRMLASGQANHIIKGAIGVKAREIVESLTPYDEVKLKVLNGKPELSLQNWISRNFFSLSDTVSMDAVRNFLEQLMSKVSELIK